MVLKESEEKIGRDDPVPNFELRGTDGVFHTLSDFSDNNAVLLVFTCNHCPYAKAKFDLLNDLAEEYDDVAVVGVNANDAEEYPEDSFDNMQEMVQNGTIAYDAYLHDETQEVAESYGAVCTPDPFLLRNEGDTFTLAYHGRLDDALNPDAEATEFYIRDAIDSVLAGEDVDLEFLPSRGCSIKWK
ncbi:MULTISPECIES: thioredoxin family protein [unclassified Haladaptatus]|uniref:thioredoxin family protein n=1 Tax=unclassified Haladaptatus TaxID=2622732 RepID=UPI00209BF442|nr:MULTISPECIES: thioredoxin family protein [unclassified Haladaptatus]MCO8246285.1 thioredoxin family protein [Haladaptatus sp. AB643]MCO8255187.1 thioredoxin family protein [Haladaptatus sp. AB618]